MDRPHGADTRGAGRWLTLPDTCAIVAVMTDPREGKVLERRPRAESFKVEDLVQEVLDGRVRVPPFQRGLRWLASDVEQLIDSIYRGYPIGTLLFWVRQGPAQKVEYGTVSVDAPDMNEAWWVVDGQQRLNALVRSLAGGGFPHEEFALYFDLKQEKFLRPKPRAKVEEHWLPLTEVVDSERLMFWLLDHPNVDRALAITLGKRIREYNVPAYLVTTKHEDAVREIFARLNSTGKRMQPNEVFSALHGARQGGSPAHVREIATRLGALGFGTLEAELLHSMMLATSSVDTSKDRVPDLTKEQARKALSELESAARSVIQFLRGTAKVPHVTLMPYELPLVALTRFFLFFPHAHPRNRELLSRWLWRGALSGVHQGNTTSKRAALEAIKPDDEHGSVQRLVKMVRRGDDLQASFVDTEFEGFRFRDARAKLLTLALWSLQPRHLATGAPIEIPNDASDLFPPARIASGLLDGLLANRIIHPLMEGRTFRRLLLEVDDEGILASHALDLDMIQALRDRNLDTFKELRETRLRRVVEPLFARRAKPHESDRPPIEALVIVDEPGEAHDGT